MFVTWRDPAEHRDDGGSWRVTGPGVPSIPRHARARLFPGLGWGELPAWGCSFILLQKQVFSVYQG